MNLGLVCHDPSFYAFVMPRSGGPLPPGEHSLFTAKGPLSSRGLASYMDRALAACAPLPGTGAPRRARWFNEARCSCSYTYGGTSLEASPVEVWLREVVDQILPLCGLKPDDGPTYWAEQKAAAPTFGQRRSQN